MDGALNRIANRTTDCPMDCPTDFPNGKLSGRSRGGSCVGLPIRLNAGWLIEGSIKRHIFKTDNDSAEAQYLAIIYLLGDIDKYTRNLHSLFSRLYSQLKISHKTSHQFIARESTHLQ